MVCLWFHCAAGDQKNGWLSAAGTKRKKTKAEMTAEERRQDRLEKKRKRKEEFDARYDIKTDGDDDFYQAWKAEMEEQAKVCFDYHSHLAHNQVISLMLQCWVFFRLFYAITSNNNFFFLDIYLKKLWVHS